MDPSRVGAVVLAAGLGRRFRAQDPAAGNKLLLDLGGKPMLQHVLDTLAGVPLGATVVVLGRDAEAVETAIDWRGERRARNPAPEEGLAGSVRVGLAALSEGPPEDLLAALVVLGDQPLLSASVVRTLVGLAGGDRDQLIFVPRYRAGGGANPVLLRREAWPLAAEIGGDRGFGPLIESRPELVYRVAFAGSMGDVDTPADLVCAARALRRFPAAPRRPTRPGR